ncbi:MAG: nucleoside deaminase [Bacteroidota bacterium]
MLPYDTDILIRTFTLAEEALTRGERPVSAVLVREGKVVAEATDAVFERSDPTAHAERIVISDYCAATGRLHLRGYELYCFIEPCLMCCGAIHWAKLGRVVYALSQTRLKELSGGQPKPGIRDYLPVGGRPLDIVGPVREAEAFALAARYPWRARAV